MAWNRRHRHRNNNKHFVQQVFVQQVPSDTVEFLFTGFVSSVGIDEDYGSGVFSECLSFNLPNVSGSRSAEEKMISKHSGNLMLSKLCDIRSDVAIARNLS